MPIVIKTENANKYTLFLFSGCLYFSFNFISAIGMDMARKPTNRRFHCAPIIILNSLNNKSIINIKGNILK